MLVVCLGCEGCDWDVWVWLVYLGYLRFFFRVGLGYWVICCFGVGYSDVGAIFFLFLIVNEQNLFSESAVCWACGWLVGKEIELKSFSVLKCV